MKKLKFNYLPIKKMETPFKLQQSELNKALNYDDVIELLFPAKKYYFESKQKQLLTIDFYEEIPFGPDMNYLAHFLFDDFICAVKKVKEFLDIKLVNIIGYDFQSETAKNGIIFRKSYESKNKDHIHLNVFEFYKLHAAIINRKLDQSILVSIFIDYGKVVSLRIPKGSTLKDLCAANSILAKHIQNYPDSKGYHPIKSVEIPLDESLNENMNCLTLTSSDYFIKKSSNILFPFPIFNRKSKFKKGKYLNIYQGPCINCTACSNYCPAGLTPSFIYHHLRNDSVDDALSLQIKSCIQCGRCSFVCPSRIPLYAKFNDTLNELDDDIEQDSKEIDLSSCGGSCNCNQNN
ncbi:MAG TPA: 4Fe-4S dicluster domain-containing protein [Victivallales bacterium]|nr:4Fe-4S dicluster domain-containing protein [Victivallales bacterium]